MTLHLFLPLQKIDREACEVFGYASTEAEDSQGEIVRRAALEAALPAYMRFANIREMHLPSAVGVAKEAAVDETGLYLKARIVDEEAWRKVKEGVYKGFSIGGAVTARDPADPRIITGVELTEISLVDRPANPEAVFAVWKSNDGKERMDMEGLSPEALKAARARLAQKWVASDGSAFGRADDAARHEAQLGKAATFAESAAASAGLTHYALEGADPHDEFADPGYQPDGKQRYPLDLAEHIRAAWSYIHQPQNRKPYTAEQLAAIEARIVAAWKAKIDPAGPPAAREETAQKGAGALARLAGLARELAEVAALLSDTGAAPDPLARATQPTELAKLGARTDTLEAELGAALPLLREMRDLVEKVASQPAVVPPSRLVAVDKGADVARELERIAAQPPALTAFELIRRAMKEPLPFGAPLEK